MTFSTKVPEFFHYKVFGLNYIYLQDGFTPLVNHPAVKLHHLKELKATIALHLARQPERLAGPEIQYLREWRGLTVKRLGQLLNTPASLVEKWERSPEPVMHPLPETTLRLYAEDKITELPEAGKYVHFWPTYRRLTKDQNQPYLPPNPVFMKKTEKGWEVTTRNGIPGKPEL